jgi:hypothetical protein
MNRLQAWIIGLLVLGMATTAAYEFGWLNGNKLGLRAGKAEIQEKWDADRLEQAAAVEKARAEKEAAERAAARQIQEKIDEYSEEIRRRDASIDTNRRELVRLRSALATANLGLRKQSEAASTGHATDGGSGRAAEYLGQCAGRLVEMGERASILAGKVIALQKYARIAQNTCGATSGG